MANKKTCEAGGGLLILSVNPPKHPSQLSRFKLRWLYVYIASISLLAVEVCRRTNLYDLRRIELDRYAASAARREKLFLSIPSPENALAHSRKYANHPHLAGTAEDFADAQEMLRMFQTHFKIPPPSSLPLFPAGTLASRGATLGTTSPNATASAWIDIYYPVLNTPRERKVEILGPDGEVVWSADLEEEGDPLDEDTEKYHDAVLAFHGLSADGDVEGQLLYANHGKQEDYDLLVSNGANFTNKIVLLRYGRVMRGLKVKGAEDLGASGVIIYTDLRDDGVVAEKYGYLPYPAGPARNPTSVQRGSVQFMSIYPGDPVTPGYPAYENATRVEGKNIPKIPSLPISWANGKRLLEAIFGSETTSLDGRSSEVKVRLVNHGDNKVTPIWNTMASIPGYLDEVIIIGNHRDAWVMGGSDPVSGGVSMQEVVRAFGILLEHGWKPLRTIVFASWDGEEYGLVGSTEWGEDFAEWISEHAVAYLNVDASASGSKWAVASSSSLAYLIRTTALEIEHPTKPGMSLWDARGDLGPYRKRNDSLAADAGFGYPDETEKMIITPYKRGLVEPLGAGSDYTVFLDRLGVSSASQGFSMVRYDARFHYHSVYDSQRWQELYADPGFVRHIAVTKHLGLLGLRLADSIIVPFNTTHYTEDLGDYLRYVEELASTLNISISLDTLREAISNLRSASMALDKEKFHAEKAFKEMLGMLLRVMREGNCTRGRFRWVAHWIRWLFGNVSNPSESEKIRDGHTLPEEDDESWMGYIAFGIHEGYTVQHQDIRGLLHHLRHHCGFPVHELSKAAKLVQKVNHKLIHFERGFLSEDGIKDRTWYRHLGVAPGKWLGYGATVFPALTEAVGMNKNVTLAEYEAARLTDLINQLADRLYS